MSKLTTDASVAASTLSGASLKAELMALHAALHTAGLQEGSRTTITADATLTVAQCGLLLVDCTGGNVALTLPTSGSTTDDAIYLVRRLDSTSNTLTLTRGGSDTVEGAATALSVAAQGVLGLQMPAGGTDWKVHSISGGTRAGARAAIGLGAGANIASAATLDLTGRTGNIVRVTGATPVTALTMNNGDEVLLVADGALPISVTGVLQYLCAAEDTVLVWQDGDGVQHASVLTQTGRAQIQAIPTPTFNAGAMTIPAQKYTLDFQNPTTGEVTTVSAEAAAMVVPSGATLGLTAGVQSDLALLALFPSAGVIEYATTNLIGGVDLSESGVISTTALSTGSDSADVVYSTTARTNVQYRVLSRLRSTQTTPGTWAQSMTAVSGAGSRIVSSMRPMGKPVDLTASRSFGVTYYNATNYEKEVVITSNGTGVTGNVDLTVAGVPHSVLTFPASVMRMVQTFTILPGESYVATSSNPTLQRWTER